MGCRASRLCKRQRQMPVLPSEVVLEKKEPVALLPAATKLETKDDMFLIANLQETKKTASEKGFFLVKRRRSFDSASSQTKRRRPSLQEDMDTHCAPPEAILERLVKEGRVIPCEFYGFKCSQRYHANVSGKQMAFSSGDARRLSFEQNREDLSRYGSWESLDIAETNADWAMRYGSQAFRGVPFMFSKFKARLEKERKTMIRDYASAVAVCRSREPDEYKLIVENYKSFVFTKKKTYVYSDNDHKKKKPRQPTTDLTELYSLSLKALPVLWQVVERVAKKAGTQTYAWSIKKLLRAQAKLLGDYEGQVDLLTDVARASIVCANLKELRHALDELLLEKTSVVVVSLKNRWAQPVDGYADVLVNLKVPSVKNVLCEVQLNTRCIYALKGETGHSTYKWLRRLVQTDDFYEGTTDEHGRPHGTNGRKTFAAGDVYEGNYKHGKKHGLGKYVSSDGCVYSGEWLDDKKHGMGKMHFANGNVYEGNFRDGRIEGQGTKTLVDGGAYKGDWKNGKPHGQGTQTFPEKGSYDGAFRQGLKDGKGFLKYANGDTYDGLFLNDKASGKGIFTSNTGGYRQEGTFRDGHFVNGTLFYEDGSTYTGRFKNGKPLLTTSSSSSSSADNLAPGPNNMSKKKDQLLLPRGGECLGFTRPILMPQK